MPGDHVVAGIDVSPGDDTVDLGDYIAITEIQLGLVQIALSRGQLGLGLLDGGCVLKELGVDAVAVLPSGPMELSYAMEHAAELTSDSAERACRLLRVGTHLKVR